MMNDRFCLRGCTKRDVHYATCVRSGPGYTGAFPCRGCAPRECRDGSLWCDKCFGRARALLADVRDLHGRLTALADPAKANPLDQVRVATSSAEPPAPVGADLLDALATVEQAVEWAYIDLTSVTNDLDTVAYLSALILNRHPEQDGLRHAWSVQDAVDRWGVERRDRNPQDWEDDDERAEIVDPVTEWDNPIVGRADAEGIAGSASTLRRWIKDGHVAPVGVVFIAGARTRLFRRDQLLALRHRMRGQQDTGRFKKGE